MIETITRQTTEKPLFSSKDLIIAMIGSEWIDVDKLQNNLSSMVDLDFDRKNTFVELLNDMEEEQLIEINQDSQCVSRCF